MFVHEKKNTAIDAFDTAHWEVEDHADGAVYTVKAGAPPQDVLITRPDGGTQTHNGMQPGSSITVNRAHGTATVRAA